MPLEELIVARGRLADQACDALRTAILDGSLTPGHPLSVPELARSLGISRSPVHQAVQRLVAAGLANEVPHKGAVVAEYGLRDLYEVNELRLALESLAARLAAGRLGGGDRRALELHLAAHRQAVTAGDTEGYVAADNAFHAAICRASGNSRLVESLERLLHQRLLTHHTAARVGGRMAEAHEEHQEIAQALFGGDPEAAENAMRRHIQGVLTVLEERTTLQDGLKPYPSSL